VLRGERHGEGAALAALQPLVDREPRARAGHQLRGAPPFRELLEKELFGTRRVRSPAGHLDERRGKAEGAAHQGSVPGESGTAPARAQADLSIVQERQFERVGARRR